MTSAYLRFGFFEIVLFETTSRFELNNMQGFLELLQFVYWTLQGLDIELILINCFLIITNLSVPIVLFIRGCYIFAGAGRRDNPNSGWSIWDCLPDGAEGESWGGCIGIWAETGSERTRWHNQCVFKELCQHHVGVSPSLTVVSLCLDRLFLLQLTTCGTELWYFKVSLTSDFRTWRPINWAVASR